jgi:photosystem I subunit XI
MTNDRIQPAGDPYIGNLATPINSSALTQNWIKNLPLYRADLPASKRGLEIGMAHGYFLYGPFALLGPLRNTDLSEIAGVLSAAGLIGLLTVALSIFGKVQTVDDQGSVTTPQIPPELKTASGWSAFTRSFMIGGLGGAFVAFALNPLLAFLPI